MREMRELTINTDQLVAEMRNRDQIVSQVKQQIKNITQDAREACVHCRAYLRPQSFGQTLEMFIKRKFKLQDKVNETSGDAASAIGNIEIKVSLGDKDGGWCMQQIRPHHNVDFYLGMFYSLNEDRVYFILIPHNEINKLVMEFGGFAHGTKNKKGKMVIDSEDEFGLFFNKYKENTRSFRLWEKIKQFELSEEELHEKLKNFNK